MDVTTVLKTDHRKVDALFEQIESASERAGKTKRKLFQQIKQELTVHAEAEEKLVYPRLEEGRESRHIALESYEEHRLVKQLLAEIDALSGDSEDAGGWDAKVKVLIDMVRHHVKEEEGEMFPKLKAALERDELRQLGEEVEAFKQSALMQGTDKAAPTGTEAQSAEAQPADAEGSDDDETGDGSARKRSARTGKSGLAGKAGSKKSTGQALAG